MDQQVLVPDVGKAEDIEVIEILVSVGDRVVVDDSLVVLESDKASMEIPSPYSGTISNISVALGDKVEEGILILELSPLANDGVVNDRAEAEVPAASTQEEPEQPLPQPTPELAQTAGSAASPSKVHAGPAVRKQAREYGVALAEVAGTGRKGRVRKEDVQNYVKTCLTANSATGSNSSGIPIVPTIDFSKFGKIEIQARSRIKQVSARNLHRSWLNIPHVTQFDEADISELEAFRKEQNHELVAMGKKLTPLAFLLKACVYALQKYPQFNASLEPEYKNLILKKYYSIGIAVETLDGLVVPVLKDADQKGIVELAEDSAELARLARNKKLPMDAMQGATFTISSLGGIGGTQFTPIVNAPEVAILGVSKSKTCPVWNGSEFVPRMLLPLSLSYDHRAIDGAEAARFTHYLAHVLTDVRRLIL